MGQWTPEWIVAVCTVLALIGGGVWIVADIKGDVREMKVTVDSLDREVARMVGQMSRFESLAMSLLGRSPGNLEDFRKGND